MVVFDEAHNIDNICIEVMSINFRLGTLEAASRNVTRMQAEISKLKESDSQRLQEEYQRLVQGLTHSGNLSAADEIPATPLLPADILQQAVPGNLRRADSFANFLKRLIAHLKRRMSVDHLVQESPLAFLSSILAEEEMEKKPLQFVSERLRTLLRTLEVTEMQARCYSDILQKHLRHLHLHLEPATLIASCVASAILFLLLGSTIHPPLPPLVSFNRTSRRSYLLPTLPRYWRRTRRASALLLSRPEGCRQCKTSGISEQRAVHHSPNIHSQPLPSNISNLPPPLRRTNAPMSMTRSSSFAAMMLLSPSVPSLSASSLL